MSAPAGQPHGRGSRSGAAGDHGRHAGLRGVSVREPVGASAPDGVCTDGKSWPPTKNCKRTSTEAAGRKSLWGRAA